MRVAIVLVFLAAVFGQVGTAWSQSDDVAEQTHAGGDLAWFAWSPHALFGPCAGDCGAAVYGGREITTPMSSVFLIHNPVAPWSVDTGKAGVMATAVSRRFASLFGALRLEAEAGLDQRLGDMHATTAWLAIDFRWTRFPWNDVVATTIAFSDGPSLASEIDTEERIRSQNGRGSDLLNFASPEITFALPDHPEDQLVFRYQHRSGIFGVINGVDEASSFACVGFRRLF